jgi:serine/threonine protein phosphatase PrpC
MSTVSLELPLRLIEPATDELIVGMSWRSHRDEDRLLVDPSAALYGVFDGAGGHGDGAGAASVAAEAVNRRVRAGLPGCLELADVAALLEQALEDADSAVAALDAERPDASTSPSATTASIALICRQPAHPSRLVAVIANLGDSRVQLLHAGRLETVTLDHSYLSEPDPLAAKARQDRLDAATQVTDLEDPMDRAAFAHRHLLANALTGDGLQDVRHYLVELVSGDRLVMDSDGVHDNLTAAELEAALSPSLSAHDAAEQTVALAWTRSEDESDELGRAKPDDMTVLVLEVRELDQRGGGSGAYRLTPGGGASLSLLVDKPVDPSTATLPGISAAAAPKQYLVTAADLQLLIARRDGSWWAMQPGAAPGERGSWPLAPGKTIEFGRNAPGDFLLEPSDQVSRRHVALALNETGDLLTVTDLHSTNGTAVLGW